jgi:flagellar hook-length control protein FliK
MVGIVANGSVNSAQISTAKADIDRADSSEFSVALSDASQKAATSKELNSTRKNLEEKSDVDTKESSESEQETPMLGFVFLNNNYASVVDSIKQKDTGESIDAIDSEISDNSQSNANLFDLSAFQELINKVKVEDNTISGTSENISQNIDASIQVKQDAKNEIIDNLKTAVNIDASNSQSNESITKTAKNENLPNTKGAAIVNSDDLTQVNNSIESVKLKTSSTVTLPESTQKSNTNPSQNGDSAQISRAAQEIAKEVSQKSSSSAKDTDKVKTENAQNTNTDSNPASATQVNSAQSANQGSMESKAKSDGRESGSDLEKGKTESKERSLDIVLNQHREGESVSGAEAKISEQEYDSRGRVKIEDLPKYVNRLIKTTPQNGSQQALINLSPINLGKLSVELTLNGNLAQIKFKAESLESVKAVEGQLSGLKDGLAKQGIKIESVSVEQGSIDSGSADNRDNSFSEQGGEARQNGAKVKREYLSSLRTNPLANNTDFAGMPLQENNTGASDSLERYI